jgi:hypothetical protein
VGPQMQQQPPRDTKPIQKVNPRRGQVKKGPVRELWLDGKQGDSVEGGEQEDGVALGLGQQLGGGISTATIGIGVVAKYNQPLHTSIKEVTVVPENQDCMEEEADVTEMPVYSTDFDLDEESKKEMEACATVGYCWSKSQLGGVCNKRLGVQGAAILFQKQCIGTRNGGICGRMFVNHAFLGTKMNFTDTEYCPTAACPAWGCKKCSRAMCDPCKGNYLTNEKLQSLGRNNGVGNDCANRRCLSTLDD